MKTAVEWLADKIDDIIMESLRERVDLLKEQAKEIEKEQIINVYWDAYNEGKYSTDKTAEEYYKEIFKQE